MKAHHIYLPFLLALAIVGGILIGKKLNYPARPVALMNHDLREQKFRQIINFIDYDYVDKVNTDSLLDLTITDLLRKLDPHSTYITQRDVQRSEESIKGSFSGIGVEYLINNDTLVVLRALPGGPSAKAGLRGGDRIIYVDDKPVAGMQMAEIDFTTLLKGTTDSKVKIKYYRPTAGESKEISITRSKIPIYSVDAAYMVDDNIGLIKINRFAETTTAEFKKALTDLRARGMTSLIIDLRDNPGGLLKGAINLADEFLTKDQLIVYTETRNGEKNYTYASSKGSFLKGDVSILINEGSASASEILAGALQDNDRATIIGRRSFGKGLVQEEMVLKDGSRVRLTTARYYTPTGRSIQKPYTDGYDAYQKEASGRVESGELSSSDSVRQQQDQQFTTPGGRIVYGGGGIMPDIFVPIDTAGKSLGWLYHYFGFGQIDRFAFAYVDSHRKELQNYKADSFRKEFEITDVIIDELIKFSNLKIDVSYLNETTRSILVTRIKALLARNLWGETGMYPILFETDPVVQTAVELLNPITEELTE